MGKISEIFHILKFLKEKKDDGPVEIVNCRSCF
jgi:hypothetical protein